MRNVHLTSLRGAFTRSSYENESTPPRSGNNIYTGEIFSWLVASDEIKDGLAVVVRRATWKPIFLSLTFHCAICVTGFGHVCCRSRDTTEGTRQHRDWHQTDRRHKVDNTLESARSVPSLTRNLSMNWPVATHRHRRAHGPTVGHLLLQQRHVSDSSAMTAAVCRVYGGRVTAGRPSNLN